MSSLAQRDLGRCRIVEIMDDCRLGAATRAQATRGHREAAIDTRRENPEQDASRGAPYVTGRMTKSDRRSRFAVASLLCVIFVAVQLVSAEVPIDPTLTDARQVILDFDRDSQNFFAAVRHQDKKVGLYHSEDGGKTWVVAPGLIENELVDIDMVVAGDSYLAFFSLGGGQLLGARDLSIYERCLGLCRPGHLLPLVDLAQRPQRLGAKELRRHRQLGAGAARHSASG